MRTQGGKQGADLKLMPIPNKSEEGLETISYLPSLGRQNLLFLVVYWLHILEIELFLV